MRWNAIVAAVVTAAALGGCSGGGGSAPPPPCAATGAECTAPGQCCSSVCTPGGTCGCATTTGAACTTSVDCCESTYPVLTCVGARCAMACRPNGDVCTSDLSCCSGDCGPGGTCVEPCHGFGGPCATSGECCADLGCSGGTPGDAWCSWCQADGESCAGDTECCSGLDCRGSTCLAGTCSTVSQPCSGNAECCAHLACEGGRCACGDLGDACLTDLDCCGQYACGADHLCHAEGASDGYACIADGDCALGNCPGGMPTDPAVCCQDGGTSCAAPGAECCAPSVCRGPADGSQACGTCLRVGATSCFRSGECCDYNSCEAGRCCMPTERACAAADECCSGFCDLYQDGTGGSPHCCGGPGAACRFDQTFRTCCDGFRCIGTGTWTDPNGICRAEPGSPCNADEDCLSLASGSVCIPRDPATGSPTVCSSWLASACSAEVPCPAPFVCDATAGLCLIPPGESCATASWCATGTECDADVCCAHPSATCDGPEDCCNGLCTGGACTCAGPGTHCAGIEDCCAGNECHMDLVTYDFACCALERSACTTPADCCYTGMGCDGVCCRPVGQSCSYGEIGEPCCDGTFCTQENKGGIVSVVCK